MYTQTKFCFLLLALKSLATPIDHEKRYDLDGNGVPDFCYEENATAHCLKADGSWTAFPATSKPTSTTIRTGSLPAPTQFKTDKGSKWKVDYVGDIKYTGALATKSLGGDKCRTGKIGSKVIWNCGDMECNSDWTVCGFSMGPAFYGTSDVMTINTDNVKYVQDNNFLNPWSGDPQPQSPQNSWGMDTSNVVAVNSTHGVAYAWEIWRGASDGSYVNRGNAIAWVTLGSDKPIATRTGPLLTDGSKVALGNLAILRDGNYIYTYTINQPGQLVIGRVNADASAFDASKYSFLVKGGTWRSGGIPSTSDTTVGATSGNPDGSFGCAVYGSVFYNTYLRKYVIICNIFENYVNMYISSTPYGPWSAEYGLMSSSTDAHVQGSYGSMAHPEYGSGNEFYFSMGADGPFNMFKITFNY